MIDLKNHEREVLLLIKFWNPSRYERLAVG